MSGSMFGQYDTWKFQGISSDGDSIRNVAIDSNSMANIGLGDLPAYVQNNLAPQRIDTASVSNYVMSLSLLNDGVPASQITLPSITFRDESVLLTTTPISVNVTGAGASASSSANMITINVPGTIAFQDEGSPVVSSATVNFVGDAVAVSNSGGTATVTITGAGGGGGGSFTPTVTNYGSIATTSSVSPTLTNTMHTFIATPAAGVTYTINLPSASGLSGTIVHIVNDAAFTTTGQIVVDAPGSDTLGVAYTTRPLSGEGTFTFQSDGTKWYLIAH